MDIYNRIEYHAKAKNTAQAELDKLNKDYWKQSAEERARRDNEKSGTLWSMGYHGGALTVLLEIHEDESELSAPNQDTLTEEDMLQAVAENGDYWEYIKAGGLLTRDAWSKAQQERAELYAIPDDVELSKDQWKRLHSLNLVLGN